MKKRKMGSWLDPRGYIHITGKFNTKDKKVVGFLYGYCSNPETITKHSFYPLIHRPTITKRYKLSKIDSKGTEKKTHSFIDPLTNKRISNAKVRRIFYATHIDAYIYSYYCKEILSPLYEEKIKNTPGLSDCVSAYRKIPVSKEATNNKSNIHFADDAFRFIKEFGKENNGCTVLTFDVSKFFDTMDQKLLKKAWYQLLDKITLPPDHFNVYKSLTDSSYVEFYKLIKEFGFKNSNQLNRRQIKSLCKDGNEFRKRVREKKLIKPHPHKNKAGENVGILQGTPISAFLANLYLLEFDKALHEEIETKLGGLYRRYSDDIIVVCKDEDSESLKKLIPDLIQSKYKLKINKDKVTESKFDVSNGRLISTKDPLTYLGFEFDGKLARIKTASISKFYRQMRKLVNNQALIAKRNLRKKGPKSRTAKIYKQDLYKKLSHFGGKTRDRNFYTYAIEASDLMGGQILKQLSNSFENLNKEIKKREIKYNLRKKDV